MKASVCFLFDPTDPSPYVTLQQTSLTPNERESVSALWRDVRQKVTPITHIQQSRDGNMNDRISFDLDHPNANSMCDTLSSIIPSLKVKVII